MFALARPVGSLRLLRGGDAVTWNYRVLDDGERLRLIECHYDDAGAIVGWCDGHEPSGNDRADLAGELRLMLRAATSPAPVLTLADVPTEVVS